MLSFFSILDSKTAIFCRRPFNNEASLPRNNERRDIKTYFNTEDRFNYTRKLHSIYISNLIDQKGNYNSEKIQIDGKPVSSRDNIVIPLTQYHYKRRFNNGKYDTETLQYVYISQQKTFRPHSDQRRPKTESSSHEVPVIHTRTTPQTRIKRAPKPPSGFVPPGLAKRRPGYGSTENDGPHRGPPPHAGPPPNRGPPPHAGPPPNRGPPQNIGNPSPGEIPFIAGSNQRPQNANNGPIDNSYMYVDQNQQNIHYFTTTTQTNMYVNGNNNGISNPQTTKPPLYWFQAQAVTPEE
ncbi:unnamed protein product [Euphydryas editha]|uniref:Uncharacterized protein n=1 Tax=Euphydryas editha TaxID=104508 RepID=A0AAU9U2G5_EUPED|nr:unnamed protein product [Euphydryas editha]